MGARSSPQCEFRRTAAEVSAGVTPLQYEYPAGNLFRYMNSSMVDTILSRSGAWGPLGPSAAGPDTSQGWRSALAVAAVRGGTITVPAGNYAVASTLDIPKSVKILGATQRGVGSPPAPALGSNIFATFAGPVFSHAPPLSHSADILIEYLGIYGQKERYPAGHGLFFTNCSNVNLRDLVVANFGDDNVHMESTPPAETYKIIAKDVYSAQAGNANFYIDGE